MTTKRKIPEFRLFDFQVEKIQNMILGMMKKVKITINS